MERINLIGSAFQEYEYDKEKRVRKKKEAKRKKFSSILSESGETHRSELESLAGIRITGPEDLEDVLDEIHEIGEKLPSNPGLGLVKEYRAMVRAFVRYVVDTGYLVEKKRLNGFKVLKLKPGERPELTLVRVVDEKLDKLAGEILANQRDQLRILERIDEIHGILVDLIH